jgi:hypothetical protein
MLVIYIMKMIISPIYLFILLNFIISAVSDVALNLIANTDNILKTRIIASLKPYYKTKTMFEAGVYAGITIVIALIITMVVTKLLIGVTVPSNNTELLKFLGIAFVIGFVIDKLIYKLKVFGNSLDEYYKEAGSGFWGALSFAFSIAISYFIMRYVM